MAKKVLSLFVVITAICTLTACGKNPLEPSVGDDPPGSPRPTYPVDVPQDTESPDKWRFISPDGQVTITVKQAMPPIGGTLVAGQRVGLNVQVDNRSNRALKVMLPSLLGGGLVLYAPLSVNKYVTWAVPESSMSGPVPIVIVSPHYDNDYGTEWSHSVPVDWK